MESPISQSVLVGRQAHSFELADTTGKIHRLEDYAGSWLLLVFHRHLMWLPCREHVLQLRQQADRIESLDLRVLVVTFEDKSVARRYVDETDLPWPLLLDQQRELYRAYKMGAGGGWDVLGPASWSSYIKLMARGRRPRRPTGDVRQLGGDVVIDPFGVVRLHHVGVGPADRPSIESLLQVVSATAQT